MKADIIGSELKIIRDNGETIISLLSNIAMIEFIINNEVQFHFKFGPNNSVKCKTSELYVNGVSSTKTDFETALSNNNIIFGLEVIKTISLELTRPALTDNYAAGDVVSNSTTAPVLLEFANAAKAAGKGCIIVGLRVQHNDITANKFIGKRFRLHLYNDTNVTPIADNAVFQMMYTNATKRVGYVDFTLPSTADGASTDSIAVQIDGINKAVQLVGTSIYAQLQILDAVTAPVSGAKMYFQMHVIQTN